MSNKARARKRTSPNELDAWLAFDLFQPGKMKISRVSGIDAFKMQKDQDALSIYTVCPMYKDTITVCIHIKYTAFKVHLLHMLHDSLGLSDFFRSRNQRKKKGSKSCLDEALQAWVLLPLASLVWQANVLNGCYQQLFDLLFDPHRGVKNLTFPSFTVSGNCGSVRLYDFIGASWTHYTFCRRLKNYDKHFGSLATCPVSWFFFCALHNAQGSPELAVMCVTEAWIHAFKCKARGLRLLFRSSKLETWRNSSFSCENWKDWFGTALLTKLTFTRLRNYYVFPKQCVHTMGPLQ